jgi:deoxyribonuclease I
VIQKVLWPLPLFLFLALLSAAPSPAHAQNTRIDSFAQAKKLLPQVYAGHQQTFYCRCAYTGKTVDFTSCGYHSKAEQHPGADPEKARRKQEHAKRLQWEHVVLAENFGRSFPEWREGTSACVDKNGKAFKGRHCASRVSQTFRFMEADLYNLMPESAETNRRRSNYQMGLVPGEDREFGSCDVEIKDRTFEPRPEIRGDIARIYL